MAEIVMIDGHTWLDCFGETGVTDSVQMRFQWIY